MKFILSILFSLAFFIAVNAQPRSILLKGKIVDENKKVMKGVKIATRNVRATAESAADGSFSIVVSSKDTLLFMQPGYEIKTLNFLDTLKHDTLEVKITLSRWSVQLEELVVHNVRSQEQIQKSIKSLKQEITVHTPSATTDGAISGPVSFLYEKYSKKGKAKQLLAKLEYERNQQLLMKELLRYYISYGIFELDEKQFDDFIAYMNLPWQYIKNAEDYELAATIKKRLDNYLEYMAHKN